MLTRPTSAARGAGAGVLVLVAVLLGSCATAPDDAGPPGPDAAAGFPVTIEHALGTTEVARKPVRVLAVGQGDVQMARALGAEVVGTTRNSLSPDGNWPAVTPPLPPEVMNLDIVTPNLEQVAALAPDLVLATTAEPDWAAAYPQLSAIAPTVVHLEAPLEDDGNELLTAVGRALGEPGRAEAVRAAAEERIDRFRAEHPHLEGRSIAFGQYSAGQLFLAASPTASSARFLERLGLRLPDELVNAGAGDITQGLVAVPGEQLAVLDRVDLGLISLNGEDAEAEFSAQPLVSRSPTELEGRLHRIPVPLAGTILTPNPASTGYVLDSLDALDL